MPASGAYLHVYQIEQVQGLSEWMISTEGAVFSGKCIFGKGFCIYKDNSLGWLVLLVQWSSWLQPGVSSALRLTSRLSQNPWRFLVIPKSSGHRHTAAGKRAGHETWETRILSDNPSSPGRNCVDPWKLCRHDRCHLHISIDSSPEFLLYLYWDLHKACTYILPADQAFTKSWSLYIAHRWGFKRQVRASFVSIRLHWVWIQQRKSWSL